MTEMMPDPPAELTTYDPTFIGRGFAWPMGVDHTGSIRLADPIEDIERSIRIVLLTAPGERVMRPQFGCRIWELMFEPITANLLGLIAEAVRDALAQWEPRIEAEEVIPTQDPHEDGMVRVAIKYRIRATNSVRNLVYPFYLIPHDAESGG